MYIDLHTHSIKREQGARSILNTGATTPCNHPLCSTGIHPWDITEGWEEIFEKISSIATLKEVVAIGECGIDKIKSPASIEVQKEVFKAHALLAEKRQKPLIVHCVKGIDELIALHKEIKPRQAWILHGFRGKPEQAAQLLKEGFYLSFGEKFNADSLAATPLNRLFIESDTSEKDILEIYKTIAEKKGVTTDTLAEEVRKNTLACNIRV